MNTFVKQFVEQFQREALQSGSFRAKLGKAETAFLEHVWGPAFQYDFTGLKAEYRLKISREANVSPILSISEME
ncbi:hypothetical protein ACFQZT_06550 [Paenibacillus sp. GCM10027628]|uniref:hypothetical protein n=1 Tax=Paenibacillus sp. GCM10027628 TaxID=3273413 RepID=UPI00363230D4